MKKIFIYFVLGVTALLTGCTRESQSLIGPDGHEWVFSENYIRVYVEVENFTLQWTPWLCFISVTFEGKEYSRDRYTSLEFNALAEKYGDTYFNKKLWISDSHPAIANEFTAISIVSDNDFNGIPAGEPLNGVIKICASSPLKYIESGYTLLFNWPRDMPEDYKRYYRTYYDQESHPVNKLLSDLTPTDLKILDRYSVDLLFMETPREKEHNFTISFSSGETRIENTIAVTFD